MVELKKLVKIGVYGGVAASAAGLFVIYSLQRKFRKSASYQEAMQHLRSHPLAIQKLGEPIKQKGNVSMAHLDPEDSCKIIKVTVPIAGPKGTGKLQYYIKIINENLGTFLVNKVELDLPKLNMKEVIFENK